MNLPFSHAYIETNTKRFDILHTTTDVLVVL